MGIKVSCPNCDQSYTLAETQEGKTVRCKRCEESFVVNRGRPSRREQEEEEDDRPRRRSVSQSREDEDEEEYDRPRRRRKTSGVPLWAWLVGGGGLLLILILVVVVVASKGGKNDKSNDPPANGGTNSGSRGNAGSHLGGTGALTLDNFRKLKAGMSQAEVRAVFGPPTETAIEQMPVWYTTNALKQPTVMLGTVFTGGKLENADLISITYLGNKAASQKLLGHVDSKGLMIPKR